MASLNKVMLIGNAGRDAELRYTANGTAQSNFSLAVNNRRRSQSGDWEDHTEWFNIIIFGDTAERVSQYITKGKPVYVEGRLQTDEYTDKEGMKRKSTKVRCDRVVLLGGGGRGASIDRGDSMAGPASHPEPSEPLTDDDIPF